MATNIFQRIGGSVDNATATFVTDVSSNTISTVFPWILGFLTLYITLYAYLITSGKVQEPLMDFLIKCGKIIFISALALNTDLYLNYVIMLFSGIQEGLTAAFSNSSGGSIYQSLDQSLSEGFDMVLLCQQKASETGWSEPSAVIGWWFISVIIAISYAIVVVVGGISVLVSTVYLKILFGIGPIFIACAMFPASSKFFDSWVGYVFNHTLIVALTGAVLTLSVAVFNHEVAKIDMDSDQSMMGAALQLIVAGMILYAVVKGVVPLAAALAGGMTMAVMGVSSMMGGAAAAASMATAPTKAGATLLAEKFRGSGGAIGQGAGAALKPAYNAATHANLLKGKD